MDHPEQRLISRIEQLHVKNYRCLRDTRLADLTPLTVLIGPNGSGKSTVFDVFAFLSECFAQGLPQAWANRGGIRELRSRGSTGPVSIELKYREHPDAPRITYRLEIEEERGAPLVAQESLAWRRNRRYGRPYRFLTYRRGEGEAIPGDAPDDSAERVGQPLSAPDLLAVNTLGQLREHPRVAALRRFISGWYLSYLALPQMRDYSHLGPERRLSRTGDNLANVLQHFKERRPDRLEQIFTSLADHVPQLERVTTERMRDGRLLLQLKDRPFDEPILARFISDGTLKMLACLFVLHDSDPPPLVGIEEPENFIHPKLLRGLGEECLKAAGRTQILVTTHSPYLLDALQPDKVRILRRGEDGFTIARSAAEMPLVSDYLHDGGLLGEAWKQGMLEPVAALARAS